MPLDPRILMIFGVALILAAAVWHRPRIDIGRASGARPWAAHDGAHP
jgi:hypothetical protein